MAIEIVTLASGSFVSSLAAILRAVFTKPRVKTLIEVPAAAPAAIPLKDPMARLDATLVGLIAPAPAATKRIRRTPAPQAVTLSPTYKLALIAAFALTAGSGLTHVAMAAVWSNPTDLQRHAFDGMSTAWQTGFGAIIGLLGGKALR